MIAKYPTQVLSSSNASQALDLFTGVFYVLRLLGAGGGRIRPSSSSPSTFGGGDYLEQDIFFDDENGECSSDAGDSLFYFEQSSRHVTFYQWSLLSQPSARVVWTEGESEEDNYPLQLRNSSEFMQDFYQDPTSGFWDFQAFLANDTSLLGYKVRPMSLQSGVSVTFAPAPKSPRGWWLQINSKMSEYEGIQGPLFNRYVADHLMIFEPQRFKLYAEVGHLKVLTKDSNMMKDTIVHKVFLEEGKSLVNPTGNVTAFNVTASGTMDCDLYAKPDKGSDIFAGILVLSPKTTPSRQYFDFESPNPELIFPQDGSLHLKAEKEVKGREVIEVEAFSTKNYSTYASYLVNSKGVRYYSWTDVYAVADIMGANGQVMQNVLVRNVELVKHFIRAKGYKGEFYPTPTSKTVGNSNGKEAGARVRVKMEGTLRGRLPMIETVQFEESGAIPIIAKF